MKPTRIFLRLAIAIAAVVVASGMASAATSARQSKPPVFWIDLSGTALQHPDFVFFTANAGPHVESVSWNGWGRSRTVGRGIYKVTSPPPPGEKNPEGPARIVAWKPVTCVPDFGSRQGRTVRIYRHAKLLRPVREGGRKWTDISAYTGYLTCR